MIGKYSSCYYERKTNSLFPWQVDIYNSDYHLYVNALEEIYDGEGELYILYKHTSHSSNIKALKQQAAWR
jgi:hypothetical protein